MQDTTTAEPEDPALPVRLVTSLDQATAPYRLVVEVTQSDLELAVIESTLQLLQNLPYETRVRALTYLRDRIESDPAVWSPNT